jgi:hypothetical protein
VVYLKTAVNRLNSEVGTLGFSRNGGARSGAGAEVLCACALVLVLYAWALCLGLCLGLAGVAGTRASAAALHTSCVGVRHHSQMLGMFGGIGKNP